MSTIVDDVDSRTDHESPVETKYLTEDGQPNVALLQDRTPAWLKANPKIVWLTLALSVLYIYSNVLPVWHTDLWGHMSYGRWIVANRAVPQLEPSMPLAKGIPFIDLPWLSQVGLYGMMQTFGVSGIQFLNGLFIVTAAGLLTFCVYGRTGSLAAALLTLAAYYWGSYQQLLVVRPQLAGLVCFTAVFMMATSARWRNWYVAAIPLTFALWANVHGSFVVGILMLGALIVGRGLDILRRTRNWRYLFAERGMRGLVLSLELSLVAILLNPYGVAAYSEVFAVSRNVNLQSLIEWDPLTLRMKQGQAAFCIALALIALYRVSPRRVTMREVLLLCGLGVGMLWHSRMITWWAPVAAYYLGLHAAATLKHWRGPTTTVSRSGGLWTVVTLGIAWIAFAYTPFGITVVHGRPKDPRQVEKKFRGSVSPLTPIDITDYLNRHPPKGLVFNTYEWGDYLQWAGPKDMRVFVNSHAHLVPEEVWNDYMSIVHTAAGWEDRLDRYGANTVVVDFQNRSDLIKGMEKLTTWEKKYSDAKGAVFVRKKPIE
ncbi:hypothetical protein SH661x_004465 [Planctomicrobium sp. SH661]|uniref:hypothetical protein n=1 Tax=Planctomicrobium sp. SH661 TaxID=3448124 RepID=UPI003F5AF3CE